MITLRNGNPRPKTPLKAIKEFCIECNGYQKKYVKDCVSRQCPLYEYRTGHYKPDTADEEGFNIEVNTNIEEEAEEAEEESSEEN